MKNIANETEFDTQIQSGKLTIVDFWAEWCHSCKNLEPVLERLSERFGGKTDFVKVNGDDNPQIAQKFGVSGYPTLVLFKNGEVVNKIEGSYPESALKDIVEGSL